MSNKDTARSPDLKDQNFTVWRVMQGRRRLQEKRIEKGYNERARFRHETRH